MKNNKNTSQKKIVSYSRGVNKLENQLSNHALRNPLVGSHVTKLSKFKINNVQTHSNQNTKTEKEVPTTEVQGKPKNSISSPSTTHRQDSLTGLPIQTRLRMSSKLANRKFNPRLNTVSYTHLTLPTILLV